MTTTTVSSSIEGVEIKGLVTHHDSRGFFREILKSSYAPYFDQTNFGQWSHSRMVKNTVKAWHFHKVQTDWWYVAVGTIDAVLYDDRLESPTYKEKLIVRLDGNDPQSSACIKIPPGVLHGLKVLSDEAHLLYITSETYNPKDEGRLPYDSEVVNHAWGPEVIVAENDKKTYFPES